MKLVSSAKSFFVASTVLGLFVFGDARAAARIEAVGNLTDRTTLVMKRSDSISTKSVSVERENLRSNLRHALRIEDSYFNNQNEVRKFKSFRNPRRMTVELATIRRFHSEKAKLSQILNFFERQPVDAVSTVNLKSIRERSKTLDGTVADFPRLGAINEMIANAIDRLVDSDFVGEVGPEPSIVWLILNSYFVSVDEFEFKPIPDLNGKSSGIEMMVTGVTQLKWFRVMGTNPSFFSTKADCPESFRIESGVAMCSDFPVESMSLASVFDFSQKLSLSDSNHQYRLPTLAERNRAAGRWPKEFGHHAWYIENSDMQTHPVGSKESNEFGFRDLRGLLWELTQDKNARRGEVTTAGGSWFNRRRPIEVGETYPIGERWTCYDVGFRLVRTAVK